MSRRRAPVLLLLLLLLCLLAALCLACAVGAWYFAQTNTGVSDPLEELRPPGTGTFRLFGGEPLTLDPALVQYTVSAEYVVEIFSGLVTLDAELRVVPDLAERWDVSADGTTYTFFLREGAQFHDGRLVTADDVKYSMERACDPRTGSRVAGVYLGDIVGAQQVLDGQAADIEGIDVADDRTLHITIDAPKAYFLAKLTYSTAFVVDRYNVNRPDWFEQANGTGPFRLVEYGSERIVLERNESFYREKPGLQRVVVLLTGGSPMSMYENGELDWVAVSPADVERVRDPANWLSADLSVVPQLDIYYLAFDVREAPFDDAKVRQAFNLAVDREKLSDVVLSGMVHAAQGIVPPGMPGYERERALLDFDPEQARRLIAESSYKDVSRLPPVTLSIGGSSGELPAHIEALVAMYRDNLGVTVAVEQTENVLDGRSLFWTAGWSADYPDPENFIDILFHSRSDLNRMGYANAQVDQLLEAARVEMDTVQRMQLYAEAERVIIADAPWVPLWHTADYVLAKPYVKGGIPAAAIIPWLSKVRIDQQ